MASPRTYGHHQEAAAAGLHQLVIGDRFPVEAAAVDQLLQCRDIVVSTLRQRLDQLTGFPARHDPPAPGDPAADSPRPLPVPLKPATLDQVALEPATQLDIVTATLPRLPAERRRAPLDVLGTPSPDPTVELWRQIAGDLVAGGHALDVATDKPWLTDPGAGWYLLGDTAAATEAVLVLDHRLREVGLLNDHHSPTRPTSSTPPAAELDVEGHRILAATCARMSAWYATTDSPDLAVPPLPGSPVVRGPVRIVSQPADLAAGQRQLVTYLRPLAPRDSMAATQLGMDVVTAKLVTAGQRNLCAQLAEHCARSPRTVDLAQEFALRRDLLDDIHQYLPQLVDVHKPGHNKPVLWQQQEVSTALRRFQGNLPLAPAQLLDLAATTHDVIHQLAAATRYECTRDASNLRQVDLTRKIGATRLHHKTPIVLALRAAIDTPPPSQPIARWASPTQRTGLRATLDSTATRPAGPGVKPPKPYPRRRPPAPEHGR